MSRLVVSCLALIMLAACGNQAGPAQSNAPAATGPAAAVQTNSYNGVGIVKAVDSKLPAIEIDHQEIVGLMPAMQMQFPVTQKSLLDGIAVNDQIDFTVENATGEMRVTAIKKRL